MKPIFITLLALISFSSMAQDESVNGDLTIGKPNDAGTLKIKRGTAGGEVAGTIGFLGGGSEVHNLSLQSTSGGGYITFRTNSGGVAERLRIANNGNVGIGVTDPLAKLSVDGFVKVEGNDGRLMLQNPSSTASVYLRNSGISSQRKFEILFGGTTKFTINNDGNVNVGSGISGNPNYNDVTIGNATSNRGIQIFSSGHSGISFHDDPTTSSTSRASYDGGIYYNHTGNEFQIWSNKQKRLTIAPSGKVGIGTDSPNRNLSIHSDASSFLNLKTSSGYEFLIGADFNGGIISTMSNHDLQIRAGGNSTKMVVKSNGNVGIGTLSPQSKLAVNGQIRATEVKVLTDVNSVPDYVFEPDYNLRTLKETKEYIAENKHLPEIPSASKIGENGIDLGDMNMRLLKKIEELTLHLIEQSERVEKLEEEVSTLKRK